MAVNEGTYVILSALDTTKAIVCYGSNDAQGTNVCIWTTTYDKWHDSQFISIVNNSDGSQRMIFTLSGKSIDIENGNVASGANVQQFSNNNTRAQKWTITADGKTIAVSGKTYATYIVSNSSSQNLVLDVTGASTADGANVHVYTKNGTNAQRWVFVPANPVPIGTYMIRSMLDTNAVIDISGQSTANGANAQLYGINYTNAQIFLVEHENGLARIINSRSGKCLSVVNDKPQNGQNVHQWDNQAYQWYIEPYGSTTINGCTVPTYIIHYLNGSGFCIDAAGGTAKPSTNIQIYTENKSKAQIWAFQSISRLNETLPVPASIKGSSGSADESETIVFNNKTNLFVSWICDGTEYQCRYRVKMRESAKVDSAGSWSEWKSIKDGSTANSGWGYLDSANCITTEGSNGSRKYAYDAITIPHTIDLTTYDRALVEVEVRRFNAIETSTRKLYEHGNSASQTLELVWQPTASISSAYWTPDGLSIDYSTDFKRTGNIVSVESVLCDGKVLCSGYTKSNMLYSGTITIPVSELKFTPENGVSTKIKMTVYTSDSSTSITYNGIITHNFESELSVMPSYSFDADTAKLTVSFTEYEESYVYMILDGKIVKCNKADGKYVLYPPSGREYSIKVYCKDSSGKWGAATKTMTGPKIDQYIWNWDEGCAMVRYNINDPVEYSDSLSPDATETKTTGREYPVYGVSTSKSRSIKVSGVYTEMSQYEDKDHMLALGEAGHCVFRNPRGDWFNVAISGVTTGRPSRRFGKLGEHGKVDIEMKVESV
jgi:hypothetical protein